MREEERRKKEAEAERLRKEHAEAQRQRKLAKLRVIGKCPVGYDWIQCGNRWQCAGGSHWVNDSDL